MINGNDRSGTWDLEKMQPIRVRSLKEEFISRFEGLILSGTFPVGRRLPSERDLAKQLGVSRPVVHEGLLDLAAKGLVTMIPRRGAMVSDYRKTGSLELLISLFTFAEDSLDPALLSSILRLRILVETDIAVLAAANRSDDDVSGLKEILVEEGETERMSPAEIAELDYRFHHLLALSSGNIVYPLLMNSLKTLYTGILETFYQDRGVLPEVLRWHREIVAAVLERDGETASERMTRMLTFSESELGRIIAARSDTVRPESGRRGK